MDKFKYKIKEAEIGDVDVASGKKTTVTDIDPVTGKISWDVDEIPDLSGTFERFYELRQFLSILSSKAKDEVISKISSKIIKNFNEFRTHLRKNYPEEYKKAKLNEEDIDEISSTGGSATFTPGTGMNYATPYAFSGKKKHKTKDGGVYTKKFGYKLVPNKIKGSGLEVKQLFEAAQTPEEFQSERIEAFNIVEAEINDIYKMLSNAKNETSDYYNENPGSYDVLKPTDLILEYLKDIKTLLQGNE
jgi:hypothetical protein|tara:strand:- start:1348 stop:2085 length:738 start_codon:yes stop_codon:yes gene_type:complete